MKHPNSYPLSLCFSIVFFVLSISYLVLHMATNYYFISVSDIFNKPSSDDISTLIQLYYSKFSDGSRVCFFISASMFAVSLLIFFYALYKKSKEKRMQKNKGIIRNI